MFLVKHQIIGQQLESKITIGGWTKVESGTCMNLETSYELEPSYEDLNFIRTYN
jgi:hypothetical protein